MLACMTSLTVLTCSIFYQGFYPVRDRSRLVMEFKHGIERVKQSKIFLHFAGDVVCVLLLFSGTFG